MSPQNIGFLHLVPFTRDNPAQGFDEAIELFTLGEKLGLNSGWLRTRHMQYGVPSPVVLFGALSQVTSRIELGNAVIPVGFENPFRLAEDLATADVLSGGRLQPGLSVHPPQYDEALNDTVHGKGWQQQDFSYERIQQLRSLLAGESLRDLPEYQGFGGQIDSDRVEPYSEGLADRLWCSAGSLKSAAWAGSENLGLLVSNISKAEEGKEIFDQAQRNQIDRYRESLPEHISGRVAVARVVVPTDNATASQVEKYVQYAQARNPRTEKHLPSGTIIAKDIIGSSEEIVETIVNDAAFQAADDYIFELPFEFGIEDWTQMLHEFAENIGPALGWKATL